MRRMLLLLSLLSLLWGSSLLCAQNHDFIEMCGVTLRIGMPQDTVLKSLAVQCKHDSMSDDGTAWLVTTKANKRVGEVFFQAGRLNVIGKHWIDEAAKVPVDVGDALYFAATHLVHEGRRSCTLEAFQNDVPELGYRRFSIFCGRKELRVEVDRVKLVGDFVNVEELLR